MADKGSNKLKRIVDHKNLTEGQIALLLEKFPYGIDEDDCISFQNQKGETILAVKLETETEILLIKMSTKLQSFVEDLMEEDADSDGSKESDEVEVPEGDLED